ncbi:MAG: hypothetical protein WCX70_01625 [Candidatus Paceibacterota bacterium]
MKKLTYSLIFLLLIVAGWLVYDYYFFSDPVVTTKKFYENWLDGEYRLDDNSYQKSDTLTDNLKRKIKEAITVYDQNNYDPVLCAQNKPEKFLIYEVGSNDKGVQVEVREDFSGVIKIIQISLIKINGKWKIDDISCGNPGVSFEVDEQKKVDNYIREYIAELSPEEPVLGGAFQVNNITFSENKNGLVEYEDGHILFRAEFSYLIDENKSVKIKSFEILPEEEIVFSEIGNLVKDEGADGWSLVYEKPGQPALRVMLQFVPSSRCQAIDGPIVCNDWEIGKRVRIDGLLQGNKVLVNFAIETEA